jgi:hypothetical protein
MVHYLRHKDVGPQLTYSEYHEDAAHVINGGVTGDVIYYDGSGLRGVPIGTANQILAVQAGVPAWVTAPAFTGITNIQAQSPTAFTVARANPNYALQVDTNTASSVTGVKITASITGVGTPVRIDAIGPGANESLSIQPKANGNFDLATVTTGIVNVGSAAATLNLGLGATGDINIGTNAAPVNINIGNISTLSDSLFVYGTARFQSIVVINNSLGELDLIRAGATLAQHRLTSGGGPSPVDNTSAFFNVVTGRYPWWADLNDIMYFPQGFNAGANSIITGTLSVSGVITAGGFSGPGVGNLDALTDVTLTSPTNNQVLGYDSSTSQWRNIASPASGGWVGTATSSLDMANFNITGLANLTFTGASRRITGDFSTASPQINSLRTSFQTSVVNDQTIINVIPNGTSTTGRVYIFGASDSNNSNYLQLVQSATLSILAAAAVGSAAQGALALRIGTTPLITLQTSLGLSLLDNADPGAGVVRVAGNIAVSTALPACSLTATTVTNHAFWQLVNGGGTSFIAVDNSLGNQFGGGPYALVLWSAASRLIELIPGGASSVRVTIADNAGVTLRHRLNFGLAATGNVNSIYRDTQGGITIWGSGSIQDVTILNSGGSGALVIPAGSTNVQISGHVLVAAPTTSAWLSTTKGLIANNQHSFVGTASGVNSVTYMANNAYHDGTNWKIIISDLGSMARLLAGSFQVYTFANTGGPGSISAPASILNIDPSGNATFANNVSTSLSTNNLMGYFVTNSNTGVSAIAGFQATTGSHNMSMYACSVNYGAPYTNRDAIQSTSTSGLLIINTSTGAIFFFVGSTEAMRIYNNTQVDFNGLVNARTNLFVDFGYFRCGGTAWGTNAGDINAIRVFRNGTALDHVFKPDYKLLPIPEMQKYYETYYHLPTIPTKEVNNNGGTEMGALTDRLWETVEVQARYISELHGRLAVLELEAKNNNS